MTNLVSCTQLTLGDNTCLQIMTIYDQPSVWDLMQSLHTDDDLADMLINHGPNDFLLSGLNLAPSYWIELLETGAYVVIPPSTIKYIYKVSIEEFFEAIQSYSPLGEAYLLNLKSQLIGLGYTGEGWMYYANEHHIYGSSRVGVHQTGLLTRKRFQSQDLSITLDDLEYTAQYRGKRHYELSNHLGNVQVVVSDKRISVCDEYLEVAYFKAEVLSAMDYYPFGMMMPDRQWYAGSDSSSYSFGFGGQLKDDEVSGVGNSYTAEFWQYDSRLGRRFNVDPLSLSWESPYLCYHNSPLYFNNITGLSGESPGGEPKEGDYDESTNSVYGFDGTTGEFKWLPVKTPDVIVRAKPVFSPMRNPYMDIVLTIHIIRFHCLLKLQTIRMVKEKFCQW